MNELERAALAAYETPIRDDASCVSLVNKDQRDDVLAAIRFAILAERARCWGIADDAARTLRRAAMLYSEGSAAQSKRFAQAGTAERIANRLKGSAP